MAKKKYYAVVKGRTPGIYFTWEDCKAQVDQYPGAIYKSFPSITEAEQFVNGQGVKSVPQKKEKNEPPAEQIFSDEECLVAYVDGSYEDSMKEYAYGCVFVFSDEEITLNGSGWDEEYVSMRNVAGEILGSEKAILWAIEHSYKKIIIYYDYEGIEKWANDIWKANKPGTIRYKEFIKEKREQIDICFKKVQAHTGDTYNEMADKLAKQALGIE